MKALYPSKTAHLHKGIHAYLDTIPPNPDFKVMMQNQCEIRSKDEYDSVPPLGSCTGSQELSCRQDARIGKSGPKQQFLIIIMMFLSLDMSHCQAFIFQQLSLCKSNLLCHLTVDFIRDFSLVPLLLSFRVVVS